jgi:hypothetical protein
VLRRARRLRWEARMSASLGDSKPYRQRTRHERDVWDAFYAGVCCTLSAAGYMMDGTSVEYMEAVATVGARDLLNFAIRNKDIELPRIRRAVRCIEEGGR